jgi:uncharacterized delta-60 repeat protein
MPSDRPQRFLPWAALLVAQLAARPLRAAPGDLDPTFGTGGAMTTDISTGDDTALAVAEQADGKVVALGRARTGASYDFGITRYLPDGSPDPTFGALGVVTTPIATGTDVARALAVQPDGKLVATGWGFLVDHWHDFAVVRYLPDGSLDPAWGDGGKVTTNIGPAPKSDDAPYAIVHQPDGRLVVAGETFDPTTERTDFALVRYEPDGTLDAGFGEGGIVVTPIGLGGSARALLRQEDDRLVAAGQSDGGDGLHVTLARYDLDGSLDPTFGESGLVVTPIGTDDGLAWGIAQQPDGALVVAGELAHAASQTTDFLLVRYRADGALDTSFGGTGIVVTPIGDSSSAHGVVVTEGRIVAAGVSALGNTEVFTLAAYGTDGTLDPGFGEGGIVLTRVSVRSSAYALTLQHDGKLVAVGNVLLPTSTRFGVVRYEGPTSTTTSSTTTSSTTSSTTTSSTTSSSTTSSTTTTTLGAPVDISLRSIGSEDGDVTQSTATSGVGGFANAGPMSLQVGDHLNDGRTVGIVSFDTSEIPDDAVILSATLRLQRAGVWGTNPFTILGECRVDVQTGAFGDDPALEPSDFEAEATAPAAGTLSSAATNGDTSSATLDPAGLAAINRTGRTQFRLWFEVHDNGNRVADRILYASGDRLDPTQRPELLVTYATP